MNNYRFQSLPSSASAASAVTILVSVWFLLAGGAIVTDQHSGATIEMAKASPAQVVEIAPEARMTIVVEGRRSAAI